MDCVEREKVRDVIDDLDWWSQNRNGEMVQGAESRENAWYKVIDVYMALDTVPKVQKYSDIWDFVRYQVSWLVSHNDIELEPDLERAMIGMLYDTAKCYIMERNMERTSDERV